MDKNTYEAYEFLPANSTETDADQFFVVQDDGTFLINRQVQYVAQVQDVKEVLQDVQPCTVYDVSSQQFFVDVDNSSELISVSDQLILPNGENGLYNNSYLLQPTSSATVEQMEEDVRDVDQYKEPNAQEVDIDVVNLNAKETNNFTEITLSDEQYHTLENKGWILLESNDKIFVLNTLGLHDITTNDELIQKLKNEIQNTTSGLDAGCVKIEHSDRQFASLVSQSTSNQNETDVQISNDFATDNTEEHEEHGSTENMQLDVDVKETIQPIVEKDYIEVPSLEAKPENKSIVPVQDEDHLVHAKLLKIKTKIKFKDIPDKILLGRTVDGKKLMANVTKRKTPAKAKVKAESQKDVSVVYEDITDQPENQLYNVKGLFEAEFVSLIQQSVRGRTRELFTPEDIASVDTVISQLLKEPNMESLVGQNLVITKVTDSKDECGELHNKSKPKLVTGRVTAKDDSYTFEHLPNLLRSIKNSQDDETAKQGEGVNNTKLEESKNFTIFHIHVTETKCSDNIVRASVTLNKRHLPINLVFDLKRRYPYTVFACGACATMFKSEAALKEHQETQCLDADDMLTIDTDNSSIACSILKGGKEKVYTCTICDTKFPKLSNCQRHVKTHAAPNQLKKETDTTNTSIKENDSLKRLGGAVYKCKMCPCTYFHPSTLSKHIVSRHINVKSNQ